MRCRSGCGPGGLTVVVFSAALLAAAPRAGTAAMLYGMGDLPGGEANSGVWAVSHDGSVAVGYSSDAGQFPPRPVYWTRDDGLVRLRDRAGAVSLCALC
jgi:hypothetical protein